MGTMLGMGALARTLLSQVECPGSGSISLGWAGRKKPDPLPLGSLELTFSNASFLLSPTTPEICLGSAPLAPSGSRTLKKKIGNFFAFKKPKSSRGSRCEKEPEGGPTAPRSRRSMLSDILRAPSKAGEPGKPLSKSEEGGLSAEPHTEPEHCQTPDSARRIRPKYSREGKSQSLILLSGEDEDALGVRHDKVSTVTVTKLPPLLSSPGGCCSHPWVSVGLPGGVGTLE